MLQPDFSFSTLSFINIFLQTKTTQPSPAARRQHRGREAQAVLRPFRVAPGGATPPRPRPRGRLNERIFGTQKMGRLKSKSLETS